MKRHGLDQPALNFAASLMRAATSTGFDAREAWPAVRVITCTVVRVVDSFANSATVTVNVPRQPTARSATAPHAKAAGCSTTGGAVSPTLGLAVLLVLGWHSLSVRRRRPV